MLMVKSSVIVLALRTEEDSVNKLVFGLKDDLKHNEVFWPQAL
jgi:hypothetical protein